MTLIGYFLLFVILSDPAKEISQIQESIATFHQLDKEQRINEIKANTAAKYHKDYLEMLYSKDQLIYWNDNSKQKLKESKVKGLYDRYYKDNYRLDRYLPILSELKSDLHPLIYQNHPLEYRYENIEHPAELELKLTESESLGLRCISYHPALWKSIILISLFLIFLGSFLVYFCSKALEKIDQASIFWIAAFPISLLVLRLSLFYIIPLSALKNTTFFSNANYFNWYNPSIGDFVINTMFIAFLSLFFYRAWNIDKTDKSKYWKATALATVVNCLFIYFIDVSKGIVYNSGVNLNIEQILTFDKYSIIVIVFLFIFLISNFLLSYKLAQYFQSQEFNLVNKLVVLGIALVGTYAFCEYSDLDLNIIPVFIFLIAYYILIDLFKEKKNKSLVWVIWWTILFSGFLSAIIFTYSLKKRITDRKDLLETVYEKGTTFKDEQAEKVFNALSDSSVVNILSKLEQPINLDKGDVVEYLSSLPSHINESIDLFQLNLEAYDVSGYSIFRNNYRSFQEIKELIQRSNSLESGIFYNPLDKVYIKPVQGGENQFGDNHIQFFYLLKEKSADSKNGKNLNYVIYRNDKTLLKSVDYQFGTDPSVYVSMDAGDYIIDGVSVLIDEPSKGVKVISAEKIANLIKPISLFSFIFCMFGLCILIFTLLNTKYQFLSGDLNLKLQNVSSLRGRIQLAIVLLVVFAFILIGVVTVIYFKNVLYQNQNKQVTIQVEAIKSDVQYRLNNSMDQQASRVILNNSLRDLTQIHQAGFSLYDDQGILQNSLEKNAPPLIDHSVLSHLILTPESVYFDPKEKQNIVSYIPLTSDNNLPYGYLKVDHKPSLIIESRIIDFISTILNVYVFLFLLAGALALSIANSITKPLQGLAQKIKQITLGQKNELLKWQRNDEIGTLIEEYNSMIVKLEESANVLARTERDLAWREMAKQVAHEIKNPLTPMKLNIQYLEKAIDRDPERAKDMIEKVTGTLIEQINNLSRIASEFSNFATMPQASNEKIVLNGIVETVHDLFRKREDMDINMTEPINDIFVFADRSQLVRVLNNLIKNAIQAIPDNRRGKIDITLGKKGAYAIIKVKDNGIGIPNNMKERVFQPNFTTKNSGTGLGLAMCSNIINALDGHIYFNSEVNVGTEFIIELPLMRLEQNYDSQNRVSLD